MLVLLALLWCVYLSDCFVRLQRDSWMFRPGMRKPFRGVSEPDLQLAGGSLEIAWTPLLPWQLAFAVSGAETSLTPARRRLDGMQRHVRWMKIASGVLFVWVMGVLSLLVLSDRLLSVLLPWTIVAALSHAGAFTVFLFGYKRTHGRRPPFETWLTLALSPVSLMRAPVVTSLAALGECHPLTAAALLCPDEEFLRIARLWHFDAAELRSKIERLARDRGLADRLDAPPESYEAGVSHYCPRCHNTYRAAARECTDCSDVSLRPLGNAA